MQLLTAPQVADRLGISESQARKWMAEGRLPTRHLGRLVRVPDEELDQWIRLGVRYKPPLARQQAERRRAGNGGR